MRHFGRHHLPGPGPGRSCRPPQSSLYTNSANAARASQTSVVFAARPGTCLDPSRAGKIPISQPERQFTVVQIAAYADQRRKRGGSNAVV
jgi:hypothetical protein